MAIIESLLDNDFYKFTMGQIVYFRYPRVTVKYAFKNRTENVRLDEAIDEDELRGELDRVRGLRFSEDELRALREVRVSDKTIFKADYIDFLENLRLPEYDLERTGHTYRLEFTGWWCEAIYWEAMALSIINELYYRGLLKKLSLAESAAVYAEGKARLEEKIRVLKESEIAISDFGTRRRFNRTWHWEVVQRLADGLSNQFQGTSNVEIALGEGFAPIGTMAHEMFMALSGVTGRSEEEIRASHNRILQDWWDYYGWGLSVALTDTYGSKFFFQDMTADQARLWKGLRQDSGDPIEFGEEAISFYRRHGIDPREKLVVFSDGLDADKIMRIAAYFEGRIKMGFGWGTNLTNDLGFAPLSLVIKLVESNGQKTVKLSDNLAKAIGSPEDIERFKRIFRYTGTYFEKPVY